jgi:hypothetical protein
MGKEFLEKTPKTQEIKSKIEKWDYTKLRWFSTAKEISECKDSLQDGRKYLQCIGVDIQNI